MPAQCTGLQVPGLPHAGGLPHHFSLVPILLLASLAKPERFRAARAPAQTDPPSRVSAAALCSHALQAWPQVGLLHASLAKLEHFLERPAPALAAADAALRMLTLTHGDGGAAVQEMQRIRFEAEAELRQGAAALAGPQHDDESD